MGTDQPGSGESTLRTLAEQRLDGSTDGQTAHQDSATILHELRVHQIELEMQNEELRRAQLALQYSYEKYFQLFDEAPVGYVVLSADGVVDDANLTAMRLLGLERALLVGRPFGALVFTLDSDQYHLCHVKLRQTGEPQSGEMRLRFRGAETSHFWAHFEARIQGSSDGQPSRCSITFNDITEHKRVVELLAQSLSTTIEVVKQLGETPSPHTASHQRRVSALAMRIAEELGLSARQAEEIRVAALIHDVDKLSIADNLLGKPSRLSPAEYEIVKRRSEDGRRILEAANVDATIADTVDQYHERCDGSGYPRGLTDTELLVNSKVLMVADVVEAMVSDRPHRSGLGVDAALEELSDGSGRIYDAEVCSACTRLFRECRFEFPAIGSG